MNQSNTGMKIYTSFEEINRDLKFLKLQKEINLEEIKISYHTTKENFSVFKTVGNIAGAIAKKAFVLKAVNKMLGITRVKKIN
ncbi:DUF6327 family protein [Aquimarina sp. W85]|uniref:DUF6327 family protein n=1 Tax=Aquimarina rhodophyticola TaxID=3342246 RepID=UPI00367356A5